MKQFKYVLLTLLTLALLFGATACGQSRRLTVTSDDFPDLKVMREGEFDEEQVEKWLYEIEPRPDWYLDYDCHVSVTNDRLFISKSGSDSNAYSAVLNGGTLVGVDIGEFDGWIRFYSFMMGRPEPYMPTDVLLSRENCQGLIEIDYEHGWALTGLSHMLTDEGAVYRYWYDSDLKQACLEKIADLDSKPRAYYYDREETTLYIATRKSICVVREDNTVDSIASFSERMYPNSMVYLDGLLYCGTGYGVLSVDPATGETIFFPMDFDKHMEKK